MRANTQRDVIHAPSTFDGDDVTTKTAQSNFTTQYVGSGSKNELDFNKLKLNSALTRIS